MNNWEILGIPRGSSKDDIKKAFRRLALIHHPDKGGEAKKFIQINNAYTELMKQSENESDFGFDFGRGTSHSTYTEYQWNSNPGDFGDIFKNFNEAMKKHKAREAKESFEQKKKNFADELTRIQIKNLINQLNNVEKIFFNGKWYYSI